MKVKVAVYGTLKSYHPNSSLLGRSAEVVAKGIRVPNTSMYDLGWYPGVVHDDNGPGVDVEVVEVDESELRHLDDYEGVDAGLYTREEVDLPNGDKAFMYFYARDVTDYRGNSDVGYRLVPHGKWEDWKSR
jgi:gamma-glutamylcyclotransferase (GGCT)/AIG2-like uncharacterized protein YtfP